MALAVFVEVGRPQGVGILRPQLEDVADLDAATDGQFDRATGTHVARDDEPQVTGHTRREVPPGIEARQVSIGLVGSADGIRHHLDRMVDINRHLFLQADRPGKADRRAGHLENRLLVGQPDRTAGDVGQLGLVDVVVTADAGDKRLALGGHVNQRLDHVAGRQAEELRHLLDGPLAGRPDGFQFGLRGRIFRRRRHLADGLFEIGCIAALRAPDQDVLAGLAGDHELAGGRAADGPALGLDHRVLEPAAVEDAAVGLVLGLVGGFQPLDVAVERVGVLHQELPGAQHSEPRANLVAELGLDLVQGDRQLLVGVDVAANDVGDHLLVRGAENVDLAVAVLEDHQVGAEGVEAAGLLPEFLRLKGRHVDFDGPRAVHLLADDLGGLAQDPPAQRQVAVGPAGQFANQPGPDHQAVAEQLGLGRHLLERRNKRLCPAHESFLFFSQ